jgi:hypothetical protein
LPSPKRAVTAPPPMTPTGEMSGCQPYHVSRGSSRRVLGWPDFAGGHRASFTAGAVRPGQAVRRAQPAADYANR